MSLSLQAPPLKPAMAVAESESERRSSLLRSAVIETFRDCFDSLRSGLQKEVEAFNSKLYTKGVISEETRDRLDIFTTLSAVTRRLESEESTFGKVKDALLEISSKKYLARKLQTTLDKKMREAGEEPAYLTQPQTAVIPSGSLVLVPSVSSSESSARPTIGNASASATVAPSPPLSEQGTWRKPSGTATGDSAITSSLTTDTDNEEERKIWHPTDEDWVDNPVTFEASGTIPDGAFSYKQIEMRNEMLEEEIANLKESMQQLQLEKNYCQKMMLKKTSEASELNDQLSTSFSNLKQREKEVKAITEKLKSVREQLANVKEHQVNLEMILEQRQKKVEVQEELMRKYKQRAEKAEVKAAKWEQNVKDAEEKAARFEQNVKDAEEREARLEQNIKDAEKREARLEQNVKDAEEKAAKLEESIEDKVSKLKRRAEEAEKKAQEYKQRAEEAEKKAQEYKQKAEAAELVTQMAQQNIQKLVAAFECRKGKIHAMEEDLDSLESQTEMSASESDSGSKQSSSDQDS